MTRQDDRLDGADSAAADRSAPRSGRANRVVRIVVSGLAVLALLWAWGEYGKPALKRSIKAMLRDK